MMGNLPPFRRKGNPSTTASNESLNNTSSHIVDVPQKDGYSNMSSLRKFGQKKLHFNKDFFQAIFVRPTLYILVKHFLLLVYVLVVCVGVIVLGLSIVALAYSCILIVSLAILPLLLVSLLITRIFQFIKYGYDYKRLTHFKHFLRGWLYIDVILVLVGLGIFYPIAKFVPSLKPVIVLGLNLTNWVMITTIVCVFYLISFLMYKLTHHLTRIGNVGSINIPQAISEIIDGLIFWMAKHEVMKRVPTFQHHEILGLPTRKWLRVSVLVLIGYNLITLFTHLLVFSLRYVCTQISVDCNGGGIWQKVFGKQLHTKFVVHFANGMRLSISFIMSSLLVLLTWVFYFGARLDMKVSVIKSTWELGKWTFTSLLIYSFLWLIKNFVLLAWEVNTVYLRLEPKIKSISEELYFLGNLGSDKYDFFKVRQHLERNEQEQSRFAKWLAHVSTCSQYFLVTNKKGIDDQLIVQTRERVNSAMQIDNDPTVDDLRRATHYFLIAPDDLRKKNYIPHILSNFDHYYDQSNWETWMELSGRTDKLNLVKTFKKIFTFNSTRGTNLEEENYRHVDDEQMPESRSKAQSNGEQMNNWNHFAMLVGIDPKETISYADFQTWVERAHNKCMFLSNTLSSAHDVGSSLNKIISWLLIGATFIMWLLLSGLATTQVLVLVASPLLAATFIFGDSCRTLFQGILFVYVSHPFDVGDLCVIDNNTMVVTAIDIWKTSFSEVDKQSSRKVMIYPNVELASKVIFNYKTKFDWSDRLEFNLGDVEKTNLTHKALIQHFKSRIKDRKASLLSSSPTLTILRKEDNLNLVIHLTYKAENTKGWTYSENFREKDRLQAEFYLVMKEIIRNFKNEYGLDEVTPNSTDTNDTSLKVALSLERVRKRIRIRGLKTPNLKNNVNGSETNT